jgi:hypothetical protein
VLQEDGEETLERAEDRSMKNERPVAGSIGTDVGEAG